MHTFRVSRSLTRWAGALLAPVAFLALLGLLAFTFTKTGLVNHFVKDGLQNKAMVDFALTSFFREVLPLYVGTGMLLFILGILPSRLGWLGADGWHQWSEWHAFWGGVSLLGLAHGLLWWEVPMTLGVLPGLNQLPMGLALGVVFLLAGAACWRALAWSRTGWPRKVALFGFWIVLAYGGIALPKGLAASGLKDPVRGSGHPARVVMISQDGLRQDVAYSEGLENLPGFRFDQAYAAIPATRLEWSILWGGNPRHYSVGHVMPSIEELQGHYPFEILEAGKAKGLKARFYIDDGGTIGLKGRSSAFDRVVEPAAGWENFLNSNLAVHIPLYAVWLDALRIFPCTTPWSPLDLGLKRALEDGRGADLVMFHSCLAHQPIYLNRDELARIPRWWALPAGQMMPYFRTPTPAEERRWKPEYSPFLAYRIRIAAIAAAWGEVWKGLAADPDYGQALRILMSDHGERFYHITPDIQMGGIHAYNLDPWELRIPLLLDGPGIPRGHDSAHAVSLLDIRNFVAKRYLEDAPLDVTSLLHRDYAPMRMSALELIVSLGEEEDYRKMAVKEVIDGGMVGPGGLWIMRYKKPASEREKDLTVAEAKGDLLRVWHPLKQGGARCFTYRGYQFQSSEDVDEAAFQEARRRIFTTFLTQWDGKPGWVPEIDPNPELRLARK